MLIVTSGVMWRLCILHALSSASVSVAAGGSNPVGNALAAVEKYSPATDTWMEMAPMPAARISHGAVSFGSDMHAIGGINRRISREAVDTP